MTVWVQLALSRIRVVFALFLVTSVVTIPWAVGTWGMSLPGIVLLLGWLGLAALSAPIAAGCIRGRSYILLLGSTLVFARLAALWVAHDPVPTGDPAIYRELASSLYEGGGLLFHDPLTGVDFRALYPPVYPLFLAALRALFGAGRGAIWASNVAIDAMSAALLVRIGIELGSRAAGRAAAWLFAVWPAFVLATPFAQKESLVTFQVLAIALVLVGLDRAARPSWREGVLMGFAAGSLSLTQPGLTPLPALLAIALLPRVGPRPLWELFVRALPFALLLLAPWWIRNVQLFGTFVPLTTTGGLGLWVGNNPDATGNWMPMAPKYHGIPEVSMSSLAARDALSWIVHNPVEFVRLTFFKLFRAMGSEQFTLGRLNLMRPEPKPELLAKLLPVLQGSLIALLTSFALVGGRLRRLPRADCLVLILLGCGAQILFFSLPFEFGERHRFFLVPFLFLALAPGLAGRPRPTRGEPPAK